MNLRRLRVRLDRQLIPKVKEMHEFYQILRQTVLSTTIITLGERGTTEAKSTSDFKKKSFVASWCRWVCLNRAEIFAKSPRFASGGRVLAVKIFCWEDSE